MTDTLTHAVTQPQPLAWALASGHCPVIPSDTRPGLEHVGRLIGIHAMPLGALVGVARLKAVIRYRTTPAIGQFLLMRGRSVSAPVPADLVERIRPWWRPGTKWGLLLDEAVSLSEPIPMRGAGGLWRIARPDIGAPSGPGVATWALEQWRKGRAER